MSESTLLPESAILAGANAPTGMPKRLQAVYTDMGVISFRVPDDDVKALKRALLNPAEIAKHAVVEAARRARFQEHMAFLDEFAKTARPGRPSLEIIREAREANNERGGL